MVSRLHCILPPLCAAALLSACGGGDPATPAATVVIPPGPAPTAPALVASTAALALAVSGQPRQFLITNVGGLPARNLALTVGSALPAGSGFTTDCAELLPGASCTISLTPGATPSAAPGDTAPVPAELRLAGDNSNTLALPVWVLDFGSVYQGGYVFDLDDTTPATGGVGGKVMALGDATSQAVEWGPSGVTVVLLSSTDGAANTAAIAQQTGAPPVGDSLRQYPAWTCDNASEAGYTDWYLPAICEMGYDRDSRGSGCGTAASPTLSNIQSRLVDPGHVSGLQIFDYWSSTSTAGDEVWVQNFFATLPRNAQHPDLAIGANLARCVRALTP